MKTTAITTDIQAVNNNTVVRYVRVSLDSMDYNRQLSDIADYCKAKDLTIIETFEEKISGKKRSRPELDRMIQYCEVNKIGAVVCTELSRIGRNTQVPVIVENFYTKGINIIPITQLLLQPLKNGVVDVNAVMMIAMFSGWSSFEASQKETRQISGMRQAAKNGVVLSNNMLPYGYCKVAREGEREIKYLAIEPTEATIVQEMFERYSTGEGIYKLACWLTAKEIPTKTGMKIWKEPVIRKILKNSLYKGERKHKDLIVDAPAIVSAELWEKVQTIMTGNFQKMDIHRKHYHKINSGKIHCAVCGMRYYANSNPKNSKYVCMSVKERHNCGNSGIAVKKLEESIEMVALDYLPTIFDRSTDSKEIENQIARLIENNEILDTQMKGEEKLERRYVNMFANDLIDLTIYKEFIENIKKNKNNFTQNLQMNNTRISELKSLIINLQDIKKSVGEWKLNGISKELLNKAIQKIVIKKTDEARLSTRKNDVVVKVTLFAGTHELSFFISRYTNAVKLEDSNLKKIGVLVITPEYRKEHGFEPLPEMN